ncbi:MAG: CoA-binding protein, partial [Nitrososphaerota archaeon]|nr:CoA-binding protein [Nitrososphaerota archaeon]
MMQENATPEEIRGILKRYRTIAVIGMSKNPEKDAYTIPKYMISKGYRV